MTDETPAASDQGRVMRWLKYNHGQRECLEYFFTADDGKRYCCTWRMTVEPRCFTSKSIRLVHSSSFNAVEQSELAKALVEGMLFQHKWRLDNDVEETKTLLKTIEVAHCWLWNYENDPIPCDKPDEKSLEQMSAEELLAPTREGPSCEWKDGFCSNGEMPEGFNEALWNGLVKVVQDNGFMDFVYKVETDDSVCRHCGSNPCLFEANKDSLVRDNRIAVDGMEGPNSKVSNKNRRYFAYRQSAFIYCEGPPGQRVKLPKCMVDGIREMWPEESGKYVGHKDY